MNSNPKSSHVIQASNYMKGKLHERFSKFNCTIKLNLDTCIKSA